MADSSDGKHPAGLVGLAALLGLAGAGRGACRGATVAAREASVLSHAAPTLVREGALVGAGAHAASGAERAGSAFAREGSHLAAGARAVEGVEHPGSMLTREGAHAADGFHPPNLAEEALGHANDAVDLGSWLLDDDDDDDDAPTDAPLRRARAALYLMAEPPVLVAVTPPGARDATLHRFVALPGVTLPAAATGGDATGVFERIRAHGGRGVVVVYGALAFESGAAALRLSNGGTLSTAALSEVCREVAGRCVLLLCAPASTCDAPSAWRAAADAWGATIEAASRSRDALTAGAWAARVPALDERVSMVDGDPADTLRVALLARPRR